MKEGPNEGADTLLGDAGADTFEFDSVNESPVAIGYDTISDFNSLEGVNRPGFSRHFRAG